MFVTHLLIALLVASLLSLLLIPFRRPRSAQAKASTAVGVLFLFFIWFLGTWAGGLWITPFGSLSPLRPAPFRSPASQRNGRFPTPPTLPTCPTPHSAYSNVDSPSSLAFNSCPSLSAIQANRHRPWLRAGQSSPTAFLCYSSKSPAIFPILYSTSTGCSSEAQMDSGRLPICQFVDRQVWWRLWSNHLNVQVQFSTLDTVREAIGDSTGVYLSIALVSSRVTPTRRSNSRSQASRQRFWVQSCLIHRWRKTAPDPLGLRPAFPPLHNSGNSQPLRCGLSSNALASESPRNCSACGSHRNRRCS